MNGSGMCGILELKVNCGMLEWKVYWGMSGLKYIAVEGLLRYV